MDNVSYYADDINDIDFSFKDELNNDINEDIKE